MQANRKSMILAAILIGVALLLIFGGLLGRGLGPSGDVPPGEHRAEAPEEPLGLTGAPSRFASPAEAPAPQPDLSDEDPPVEAEAELAKARVEGLVVGDDGAPIARAQVWVLSEDGARVSKADDAGHFRVIGNDAGPVRLIATAPGDYTRASSAGEVTARDGDVAVELRIRALVSATLVLDGWNGIPAGLMLAREDGAPHFLDVPKSGRADVRGLVPGAIYTVIVRNNDRSQVGIILELRPEDAESHTIRMVAGSPLRVDVDGVDRFSGVRVDAIIGHAAPFASPKGDGRFDFRCLPAGEWRIRVTGVTESEDVFEADAWVRIPRPGDLPLSLPLSK